MSRKDEQAKIKKGVEEPIQEVEKNQNPRVVFDGKSLSLLAKLLGLCDPTEYGQVKTRLKEILGQKLDADDLDQKALTASNAWGKKSGLLVTLLAKVILAANHFAQDAGGKLYFYQQEKGVYQPKGEKFVKKQVKLRLERWNKLSLWTSHRAKEVVEFIGADSPLLWDRPLTDCINVLNGIVDVRTREIQPHTPEWLSTAQIPVAFDPKATCPFWDKFVNATFPEDTRELA